MPPPTIVPRLEGSLQAWTDKSVFVASTVLGCRSWIHAGQGIEYHSNYLSGRDSRVGLRHEGASHPVASEDRPQPRRGHAVPYPRQFRPGESENSHGPGTNAYT